MMYFQVMLGERVEIYFSGYIEVVFGNGVGWRGKIIVVEQ